MATITYSRIFSGLRITNRIFPAYTRLSLAVLTQLVNIDAKLNRSAKDASSIKIGPTTKEGLPMSAQLETKDRLIFRGTNSKKGRRISITPDNSSMKHLVYGRIILDQAESSARFSTGPLETGLLCLSGDCTLITDGQTNKLGQFDSIYIPRDTAVEIK